MLVLRKSVEFNAVYERGAKTVSRSFVVFALPNGLRLSRYGLTTPRKLGKAHDRNRIRRRVKEIIRQAAPNIIPVGFDCVINPRRSAAERPFIELRDELTTLLVEALR